MKNKFTFFSIINFEITSNKSTKHRKISAIKIFLFRKLKKNSNYKIIFCNENFILGFINTSINLIN